jgi:hypothetical protein
MKPHEETLTAEQYANDQVALVSKSDRRMVAVFRAQDAEEWRRFILAAPAMARALLAHVTFCVPCKGSGSAGVRTTMGAVPQPCPACEADRAALKEAGVLE